MPKPNALVEETSRQNLCQIRGAAFRKIARQVIKEVDGEDMATEERVRHLAKSDAFQEIVEEAFIMHFGSGQ